MVNFCKLLARTIILILICLIFSLGVFAASFSFNPMPPDTFQIFEDVYWSYDVNITIDESLANFSKQETQPFPNLSINSQNGLLQFTPNENNIGLSGYFLIIVQNLSNPALDYITTPIRFNISNSNDAPNITSYTPASLTPSVAENSTLAFNITASDADTIYGDSLNYSWSLDGIFQLFSQNWTYYPDICMAGTHNITGFANDTSNASATMNWSVIVNNLNRVPIFNITINNLTWNEDYNISNNITLSEHFYDLDTECNGTNNDTITYSAVGNSSIRIVIDPTSHNASFYPSPNWYGIEYVVFTINDGYTTVNSNNITLIVNNVNDSPILTPIPNQSLYVSVPFYYQVNATDPDNNTLAYWDNTTLFDINSSNGLIILTPNESHIGLYYINITVGDQLFNVSQIVVFNVSNNSIPVLNSIGNLNATVGRLFNLNITASDLDNNSLSFYTNSTFFSIVSINATAGMINFTPQEIEVGNHSILMGVNDSRGAVDYEIINFTITMNYAPNLTLIQNQTARVGKAFTLIVHAADPNNDQLNFMDNATFFNITSINSTSGLINFTPESSNIGLHIVNISVSDSFLNASQLVWFNITENHAPIISTIDNYTARIGIPLLLNITGSDQDNDQLIFYDNSTIFNITSVNSTAAIINFTPTASDQGHHLINITANDGDINSSILFWLNITENHQPILQNLSNQTTRVGFLFTLLINASDIDNDVLTFYSNTTIFNITAYNQTNGLINFTPIANQTGNYMINITVSDGYLNDSKIFWMAIEQNTAPNITSYYPPSNNTGVKENSSIYFNITAIDPNGDNLTYIWALNGNMKSDTSSWLYSPNFTAAGSYNLTVVVSDGNLTDYHYWNLTVNNTNRPPRFGIIIHTTESDFASGTNNNTNTTLQSGNITLSMINATHYYAAGNFTSPIITLQRDYFNNISLGNLSWSKTTPSQTSITMRIRASSDNITWSNWTILSQSSGEGINASNSSYYVQYMAELTTDNQSVTPALEEASLGYNIPGFIGYENAQYNGWIDLDDYFTDEDGDLLTYNVSSNSYVTASINANNEVSIIPTSNWYGTTYLVFTANDSTGNDTSNNISITFIYVPEQPSSGATVVYRSSGGGGTTIITKTALVNKTELATIELIVPQPLHVISNATFMAPIILRNNGNMTLRGVFVNAYLNSSDISLSLTQNYFEQIDIGDQKKTDLYITMNNATGSYSIIISALVSRPKFNDTAMLQINILENFTSKINFVRDFLNINPQCLELTEAIERAQSAIKGGNSEEGNRLLDSAIEGCKYLITASEKKIESPKNISAKFLERVLANRELTYTLVFILVTALSLVFYVWYNLRTEL